MLHVEVVILSKFSMSISLIVFFTQQFFFHETFQAPFDQRRLVFPPAPAAVFAVVLYQILLLINFLFNGLLCNDKIFMAGALSGYLCYDMIHYYIHFGSPRNSYFYHLKRYHYNHHFANQDQGFGISSPFWDLVFGTKIVLKKLKYVLKW